MRKKKRKHKSDIYNITVIYNDFNLLAKSGTKLRFSEFYACCLCVQEGSLMIAMRSSLEWFMNGIWDKHPKVEF